MIIGNGYVTSHHTPWGFFGHRLINKMAVFTLPQEMLVLFKKHIHYLSVHAVDPDKRRYALKNEAYRHYIDLDHWDTIPFLQVPRELDEAILKHGYLWGSSPQEDTILLSSRILDIETFYSDLVHPDRYSSSIELDIDEAASYLTDTTGYTSLHFENPFVAYGVLPYFLEDYYRILVKVMSKGDLKNILKISADIGHYIGDAHVPLHTTENYNGQLTNQLGIHAFWESRLPELFAMDTYDMVVGKADYIENKKDYFWNIILESHSLLAEVLDDEISVKSSFPEDQQFCFDNRSDRTVRTQCPEFSEAYHIALDGMVEERMQDAILSIGCVWYSAWIDAGQPDLSKLLDNVDEEELKKEQDKLNQSRNNNEALGRGH